MKIPAWRGTAGWQWGLIVLCVALIAVAVARADEGPPLDPLVDEILSGVEARYASSAFAARFDIASTLKAMQVTDTASGRLMVKYPGKTVVL